MSRLTRDGTAEPVSRDQILRHARGQGNVIFPCSADHEQDWQPYPVDPYLVPGTLLYVMTIHTYIHTTVSYVIYVFILAQHRVLYWGTWPRRKTSVVRVTTAL